MRSNYKTLGPYIRELKNRNRNGAVSDLRGVSIGKGFMPSVANVNGTDLSKYKRVEQRQFAFNPMHVGRDEVLPIALLAQEGPVVVSPAYVVFEVLDHEQLLPEYLMMWCRRPEFDRNAWFTTDNSVRGGFSWRNFCDMELPIPSVEKQREIVKEYQTVVDRIRLNERLNEKLEEVAQAIYKQWFVDFEFPMTAEYAEAIGKPELAGQPYKSSGGEMEYNEFLEQEIPKRWTGAELGELVTTQYGYTASAVETPVGPKFLRITDISNDLIGWDTVPYCPIEEKTLEKYELHEGDVVIARTGATVGYAKRINKRHPQCVFASYLIRMRARDERYDQFIGLTVVSPRYRDYIKNVAVGSGQEQGNAPLLRGYRMIVPPPELMPQFSVLVRCLIDYEELAEVENATLRHLSKLHLAMLVKNEAGGRR